MTAAIEASPVLAEVLHDGRRDTPIVLRVNGHCLCTGDGEVMILRGEKMVEGEGTLPVADRLEGTMKTDEAKLYNRAIHSYFSFGLDYYSLKPIAAMTANNECLQEAIVQELHRLGQYVDDYAMNTTEKDLKYKQFKNDILREWPWLDEKSIKLFYFLVGYNIMRG
jgi:hypothetical protein